MTSLLEEFLSESRDVLQGIGEKLMQLEVDPADPDLMTALFRMVHTLKGNSGLFEFPEMTRVLHAGEDLMDAVRHGRVKYSKDLADRLLDAMDFVGMQCDEIAATGGIGASHAVDTARLVESLRGMLAGVEGTAAAAGVAGPAPQSLVGAAPPVGDLPEAVRADAYGRACAGATLHWIDYCPAEECFFQGEDPFFQARGTPGLLWGRITAREAWPSLTDLDAYRCILDFHLLTTAPRAELDEHFRYMPDRVRIVPVPSRALASPEAPATHLTSEETAALRALLAAQREILALPIDPVVTPWHLGRLKAVAAVLSACLRASGDLQALAVLDAAAAPPLDESARARLLAWLDGYLSRTVAAPAPVIAADAGPPRQPGGQRPTPRSRSSGAAPRMPSARRSSRSTRARSTI